MGRTKARKASAKRSSKRQSQELSEEQLMFLENMDIQYRQEVASLSMRIEGTKQDIKNYITLVKVKIGDTLGNMRLSEFQDDVQVPVLDSTTRRRSKSCSSVFAVPQGSITKTYRRSKSQAPYVTPAHQPVPFNKVITPKINENTAFAVMRQPRQGEWTFSMDGSPLLGPSSVHGHSVNVNIATEDGSVVSILPQPGLQRGALPKNLSMAAKLQLHTIYNNLRTILQDED